MSGVTKVRVGGVWQGIPTVVQRVNGVAQRVVENLVSAILDVVVSPSVTETADDTPLTTPATESLVAVDLVIPFVAASVGSIAASTSFTLTRPTGTASGDKLFLVFHCAAAEVTAPTITGWTLLSGLNQVTTPKFALYHRIADLTATDIPTVTLTNAATAGWMVAAFRSTTTISVSAALNPSTTTTVTGSTVTTIVDQSLVLVISASGSNVTVGVPTGVGWSDVFRSNAATYAFAISTAWVHTAGSAGFPTWTLSGASNTETYALALRP